MMIARCTLISTRQCRRDQQNVHDLEARQERVAPGEGAAPDQGRELPSDEWDRHRDRVRDREPHAGEKIVDERVAGEAFEDREHQHGQSDEVVEVAGLAVGAGEEHAHDVQHDRGDEHVGGPVMHLAEQQSGGHGRREVEHRAVRLRHLLALQERIGAVVDDLVGAGDVVERQEDAGPDEDDEGVERDFPEQERPVVGEHVAHRPLDPAHHAQALVAGASGPLEATVGVALDQVHDSARCTPHQEGPMSS